MFRLWFRWVSMLLAPRKSPCWRMAVIEWVTMLVWWFFIVSMPSKMMIH